MLLSLLWFLTVYEKCSGLEFKCFNVQRVWLHWSKVAYATDWLFFFFFFFSVCAPKLRPLFNNGHVVSIMVGILRLWSGGTLQVKWARSNFRITDKEHRQKTHLLQQSTQMWIPTFILAGSALCLTLRVRGRGRGGGGAGGGFLRGSGGMGFLKVIIVARLCTHQHE